VIRGEEHACVISPARISRLIGVGLGRDPQRWLAPGDELVSYVEGIGKLRH
jgi:hypothetical protein